MSLRKSPVRTPAFLAACRANAQKSTGPRTPRGKGQIVLNALKHGRYCKSFRENLIKAHADVETYDWILDVILRCFDPHNGRQRLQAEMLAREIWCNFWHVRRTATAIREPGKNSEPTARPASESTRFSVVNPRTGRQLTFKLKLRHARKTQLHLHATTADLPAAAYSPTRQPASAAVAELRGQQVQP